MILQGRFNSVFTPQSLTALSQNVKNNMYLGDPDRDDDFFNSARTVSIEYKCDKNYVG